MGMISRAKTQTLKAIVFDRWTVERADRSPLVAIYEGLKKSGRFEVSYFDPASFDPDLKEIPQFVREEKTHEYVPDVIFTFGFNFFEVQDYYFERHKNTDIVTVDYGFIARDKGYRYVVKNGEMPLKSATDGRFRALGLKFMDDMHDPEGHILVCMQDHDREWYDAAIAAINLNIKPGREIRLRQPKSETPLEEDMKGAHSIVSFNSTCLYQGILARLPVFCHVSCLAKQVGHTDFEIIEQAKPPTEAKAQNFLNRLAYAQWRLDELRNGIWVDHYFPKQDD